MAETPEDRARFEAEGRKRVVRLKMPRDGQLLLQGSRARRPSSSPWAQEADHVIQRTDGSFIYHLANVVDDHDFGITHVIRAEEHLSNTPRQIFIAEALGYPLPAYAHLPYVAEPGSKRKLSKRKLDAYLKNPDFAKVHQHGTRDRGGDGAAKPRPRRSTRSSSTSTSRSATCPTRSSTTCCCSAGRSTTRPRS